MTSSTADRPRIRRQQDPDNLAWIDLEMTGLDSESDVILQAALVVTNRALESLEEFACDVWQPAEALGRMAPIVRQMHERTGLLDRIATARLDVRQVEQELLQRVAGWCPYPAVLCGSSIWSDRRFIDRYMPGLARYLHYRMLDVSSIKLLARKWYGQSHVFSSSEVGKHDALADVRRSIAELQHYRRHLFVPAG
jgi:oligoribonuclease